MKFKLYAVVALSSRARTLKEDSTKHSQSALYIPLVTTFIAVVVVVCVCVCVFFFLFVCRCFCCCCLFVVVVFFGGRGYWIHSVEYPSVHVSGFCSYGIS